MRKESSLSNESIKKWMTYMFFITVIFVIWLLQECSGDKKDALVLATTQRCDSLQKLLDDCQNQLNDCKNQKPILIVERSVDRDNNLGTSVRAIFDPNKNYPWITTDSVFIKDVVRTYSYKINVPAPCPKVLCPECPQYELKDSCVVDTIKVNVTENNHYDSSKKILFAFEGFRLYPTITSPNFKSDFSCFKKSPEKMSYSYSYNKIFIDKDLIKSAKIKNWVATGLRLLSMGGYAYLYHSDRQFAISANGVGPYEEGNPFRGNNLIDRKIATRKACGEVGLWVLFGGSEWLNYSSQNDYQNAYSSEMMSVTFNVQF